MLDIHLKLDATPRVDLLFVAIYTLYIMYFIIMYIIITYIVILHYTPSFVSHGREGSLHVSR